MNIRSRIQGGIIGSLTGEAVGLEFSRKHLKTTNKSEIDSLFAAYYADAGSMSLCTMSSINETGKIDEDDIAYCFHEWYIGDYLKSAITQSRPTISEAMRKYGNGMPVDRCGSSNEVCDNAALMRMLPIALWSAKESTSDIVRCSKNITNFTNKQIIGEVCSALFCLIVSHTLLQISESATKRLEQFYTENNHTSQLAALKQLQNTYNNVHRGTSEVKDSFWSAWTAYANNMEDFNNTTQAALQYGNNCSITTALACSLSGMLLGIDAIPKRRIKQLKLPDAAKNVIKSFEKNVYQKLT